MDNWASGIYTYTLEVDHWSMTKRMSVKDSNACHQEGTAHWAVPCCFQVYVCGMGWKATLSLPLARWAMKKLGRSVAHPVKAQNAVLQVCCERAHARLLGRITG